MDPHNWHCWADESNPTYALANMVRAEVGLDEASPTYVPRPLNGNQHVGWAGIIKPNIIAEFVLCDISALALQMQATSTQPTG